MFYWPPVDSYQDSIITKYNTNMQVQKKYNMHNNSRCGPMLQNGLR